MPFSSSNGFTNQSGPSMFFISQVQACVVKLNSCVRVYYIYASMNWVINRHGSGLSPLRRQAITRSKAGLLSVGLLETYFSEIWIIILSFSFKKMQLKMSSAKMMAILSRVRWVNTGCFVTNTNVSQNYFRQWSATCLALSQNINQYLLITNWIRRNKFKCFSIKALYFNKML